MCEVERKSPGAVLKTGFWTTPRRQSMSMELRCVASYIHTCPERTAIGLFPVHHGEVAGRMNCDVPKLLEHLQSLVDSGEIVMNGYWILVLDWWDHNHRPGPGFRDSITRVLKEAPPKLREEWEAIAMAAGVYPFGWDENAPPTRGGTTGTTRGNNNHNLKVNNTTTTTMRTRLGPHRHANPPSPPNSYADIVFHNPEAEQHRPAFLRVCAGLNATPDEAHELALELNARIKSGRDRPELRIQLPEAWMLRVVQDARAAGAPILRAGTNYAQEEAHKAQRAAEKHAAEVAAQAADARQELEREQSKLKLQELDEKELTSLADAAAALMPPNLTKERVQAARSSIQARVLPNGLGYTALQRAMTDGSWRTTRQ